MISRGSDTEIVVAEPPSAMCGRYPLGLAGLASGLDDDNLQLVSRIVHRSQRSERPRERGRPVVGRDDDACAEHRASVSRLT